MEEIYLYGRAVWCGDELDDYAFDSDYIKLSKTKPTEDDVRDVIFDICNDIWSGLKKEELKFEIENQYLYLECGGKSDTYEIRVQDVDQPDESFEFAVMITKIKNYKD